MKPDAYALRNSQGYWLGIWNNLETAEGVRAKNNEKEEIVEVFIRTRIDNAITLPVIMRLENNKIRAGKPSQELIEDTLIFIGRLATDYKEAIAALEASTKELIGERDCLYESHADPETGEVTDDEGKQGLAELDAIIDRNHAVIKKAKGEI